MTNDTLNSTGIIKPSWNLTLKNTTTSTGGGGPVISDGENSEIKITFNIFTYTLPFVAFILDHSTKRLKNLPEKSLYIMLKLIAIVYYLGAYVLALQ
jgi:hypothetical protein